MRLIDADALTEKCGDWYVEEGTEEGFIGTVKQLIDAQPTVQPDTTTHDSIPAETGKNDGDKTSGDCISRQAVTKFLNDWLSCLFENCHKQSASDLKMIIKDFKNLPSAQPEQHEIGYSECANAMLKMWIDNVLTDGEYNRIMDKLNAHWAERREDATD